MERAIRQLGRTGSNLGVQKAVVEDLAEKKEYYIPVKVMPCYLWRDLRDVDSVRPYFILTERGRVAAIRIARQCPDCCDACWNALDILSQVNNLGHDEKNNRAAQCLDRYYTGDLEDLE